MTTNDDSITLGLTSFMLSIALFLCVWFNTQFNEYVPTALFIMVATGALYSRTVDAKKQL